MKPRWALPLRAASRPRCRRARTSMRVVRARDGSRVRADVDRRRPRRPVDAAGRVSPAGCRRRQRADRRVAPTDRCARFTTSAAIAARGCALKATACFAAAFNARITPGPTGSTAGCWPRRRWTRSTGFDRADYPLREVACETWDGHIFINLADSPAPLAAQLGELPQRFAPWAHAGSAARATDRVRRRDELEAGGPELQRVPALPGDPSAAQPDASLPRRGERAHVRDTIAAARWASRTASRHSAPTASGGGISCRRDGLDAIASSSTTSRSIRTSC